MTIIEQKNNKFSWIFLAFAGIIVINLGWSLFNYNQTVNCRHDISKINKSIQEAEVQNAEFKTNLIQLTSDENVKKTAEIQGLVLENNPEYLQSEKLASVR